MKRTTAQRVIEAIERLAGIPGEPYTQTIDVADYEIIVGGPVDSGLCPVELWMVPHKTYTAAKTRQPVYSFMVSQVGWSARTVTDHVLSRAFGAMEQKP